MDLMDMIDNGPQESHIQKDVTLVQPTNKAMPMRALNKGCLEHGCFVELKQPFFPSKGLLESCN